MLMHGLDVTKNVDASLQMQFFQKYITQLEGKNFSPKWSGDGGFESKQKQEPGSVRAEIDKSDNNEDQYAYSRLAFQQTTTFFKSFSLLESALSNIVFDFVAKQRIQKREHIDFSNISKYIKQAVFLENDVMMFERMPTNQMLLKAGEHDIVGMAAYVLRAIYQELLFWNEHDKNWKLPNDALPLIEAFEDKYHLELEATLFADFGNSDDDAKSTELIPLKGHLKAILMDIDESTPFKTPDYEDYFDALHGVLFDAQFSVENLTPAYHQAWEELCLFCAANDKDISICFFDDTACTFDKSIGAKILPEAFKINDKQRRPDLVFSKKNADGEDEYWIIDFKHYLSSDIKNDDRQNVKSQKLKEDLDSMDVYVLLLANHLGVKSEKIKHAFWLPAETFADYEGIKPFVYQTKGTKELMRNYLI